MALLMPRLPRWGEEFVDAARRRGARDSTVQNYAEILDRLLRLEHLDLAACSEKELNAVLSRLQHSRSPRSYRLYVTIIKMTLNHLGRKNLAEKVEFPRAGDPAETIKTVDAKDVDRLIREAPTPQDRLIVELFSETGARRGELAALRIKDVQFDEYGAILHLQGKSGTRRRRVYASVPDLRDHLNNHPSRDDPNASLLYTSTGKSLSDAQIYHHVRVLSQRILGHAIYPHQFRHTRATEDSRLFTDREMMQLFGWRHPYMVGIYSHLSMRDVEDKDLVLHGLKKKEDILRPLTRVQRCPKCQEENAPVAIYCTKCGNTLAGQQANLEVQQLRAEVKQLRGQFETLAKAKYANE
jgi:integrase